MVVIKCFDESGDGDLYGPFPSEAVANQEAVKRGFAEFEVWGLNP